MEDYTRNNLISMIEFYDYSEEDLNSIAYAWFTTSDRNCLRNAGIEIAKKPIKVKEVIERVKDILK